MKNKWTIQDGFSLIELLVVIAITAVLLAVALPNLLSTRERARDAKKKQEMNEMKNALRLYYNDFQKYPAKGEVGARNIAGCGLLGTSVCPLVVGNGCEFSAKSDTCDGASIYMKRLPDFNGTTDYFGWNYYDIAGGDKFVLMTDLENAADPDILESQTRCPAATYTNCSGTKRYCVCDD